ncbi:UNVERIFIED_ORG: [acyl-carrier-protein] S-malonyltransferase [Methylobacterium sp. SuP10 SLI 274]|uniref:ACP S-malonyltransferase n=1 Tax=Methylorubrum extorquens TaxID=408 RepID=UPI00209CA0B5|nr:ACP S-malonyltransferase [Methylorubrum extorquens]MDF9862131.1 [acyl-carrier-protein] S-malonyltransferase [Methylorubrum pseudosasae]MDH6635750.1 [acyl-carrier-protein] S-malonyltransferase [Methylobacterium sp. SuP10 SLI 274]MDH6664925.1 [acyl-carrier-protein] S-malonyltransferase [Methylorubrum zatmanii]MCP1556854.1 [acyl-carrier-protein] S-malonyltransferase [Methylorubrum extorquens]MDF9790427.1 [acyl-carrier-protein] S-malonyltransferase [Methylorubrum extorquens]
MTRAFIFPGQGSQAVGMGKALSEAFPAARQVFEEVDAALGQNLSRLMFEGPSDELTLTANAQPALMAASLAVLRTLEAERGLDLARDAAFVAGHSLGEYSALAAAGTFSISDTARLLRIRGEAMQRAVAPGIGAMAALIGPDLATARNIAGEAAEGLVCDVANDNGGGQVVLSGHREAVERAMALAQSRGVRRAVLLNVSAPFHCALMAPAAEAMRRALAEVPMHAPAVPVYANVTAGPLTEPDAIRNALITQVTGTVRWSESVAAMAGAGVDRFFELGAGKVLTGLVKRIAPGATASAVGTPDDVAAYA